MSNIYMPFKSKIISIKKHTDIEYSFRMEYYGDVKPGQFFEVSLPRYGEAPISVSEIGEGYIELTIRRVGVVTDVIHSFKPEDILFLRGPYGNGFDIDNYKDKELIVAAGGTGLSPVKGVIDYFADNIEECKNLTVLVGFKTIDNVLFEDNIERWKKTSDVTITVDSAEEGYSGKVGLVTKYIPDLKINNIDEVQVIVVGPPMMMKFTVLEFLKLGIKEENIWISQERKMCCGVGKCGHCKIDDTYICVDGPVFNYIKGKTLID